MTQRKGPHPVRFLPPLSAWGWLMLCALLCLLPLRAQAAMSLTCTTSGDFGTANTQATITGPNNLIMDTTGAITYPPVMTGSGSGTAAICTLTGAGNGNLSVSCDASRTITNSGGCCGTANRSVTSVTVAATGSSNLAQTACRGLGTGSGSFKASSGTGQIRLGITMDATDVRIGGSYKLSSNAAGPINVQVSQGSSTATATADFTVAFTSQVGISNVTNMDFGRISMASQPGASDHVDLGTNGSAVYAGTFSAVSGAVTAGSVTMNNIQDGVTVEVRCDTATTLTNGAGKSIQVTGMKVAAAGNLGSYASAGTACAGSGAASPATTMVFNAATANTFYFGGKLDGSTASAGFTGGTYSTANAGGVYAVVNILTQ